MAQLFDDVFNPRSIYDMLFFNAKSVLTHPTLEELEKEDKPLYNRWLYIAKSRYNADIVNEQHLQTIYEKNAVYFPEFSRILAITYATLYVESGTLKRYMKKIVNEDEFIVLQTFMDELYHLSSDGAQATPEYFPIMCGHNILSYDIPLLIKRFIFHRKKMEENKQLPLILKRSLGIKPWESGVVDTVDVWKFNGYDKMPLMLIADFMGLKKTVDLLPLDEVSRTYWEMAKDKPEDAMEFVSLQSATQTNLVIQLMNELRQL
jgi:hypothetical protein